ncbi:MAG TPA: sigma-70 family RNA polymerase sigma factor [Chthoniobacterales bacterium]|nr:sigma-70 family RNA polymerase sigma factor [Chthoniobacterales bacterium]
MADDELELVHCAQKGDALAFAELMGKYRSRIIASICHSVQDEEEALDIYQKVCVKVWQSIRKFELRCSFYTWIYTIANREAVDWLRRSRPCFVELDANMRSTAAGPDRAVQRKEMRRLVRDAIAKLPPKQRAVVVLKDLENFQYGEIAKILHCSIGTVMSRLFYGRQRLQGQLRPLYESML